MNVNMARNPSAFEPIYDYLQKIHRYRSFIIIIIIPFLSFFR